MDDMLEWVEKAGAENMKFRVQNAESLAKDATTTLTVLLTGLGGALAFVAKGLDSPQSQLSMIIGASVLSVWFMALAAVLIHYCIRTRPLPAPTNEPKNLFQPTFQLNALREVELENLQERITQITVRNAEVAVWLDRVRYLAACSPLLFAISVAGVAYWPVLCALVSAAE